MAHSVAAKYMDSHWEELIKLLLPSVITKHSISPKSVTSKKVYDKMKDVSLKNLGLTESIVDSVMSKYINCSTTDPTIHSRKSLSDAVALPSLPIRSNSADNVLSIAGPTPQADSPPVRAFRHRMDKFKTEANNSDVDTEAYRAERRVTDADFNNNSFDFMLLDSRERERSTSEPSSKDHQGTITASNLVPHGQKEEGVKVIQQKVNYFKSQMEQRYESLGSAGGKKADEKLSSITWEENEDVIEMAEVIEDSPIFQKTLKAVENETAVFGKQLKSTIKCVKESCDHGAAFSQELNRVSEELDKFRASYDKNVKEEQILEHAMAKFAKTMQEAETIRQVLLTDAQIYLIDPLEKLVNAIKDTKDLSKQYQKFHNQYETITLKNTKQYNRKAETETLDSKAKMRLAGLDLAYKLNELHKRKKYDTMESVCMYLLKSLQFYKSGYDLYKNQEELLRDVYQTLRQKRTHLDKMQKRRNTKRSTVEQRLLQRVPDLKATSLQGYLFSKEVHTVHSPWKKRYFAVDQGFFVEKKMDLSTKKFIDLMTCTVKPKPDPEDPRYVGISKFDCKEIARCFEVVSPYGSYYLQAETEELTTEWVAVLQNAIALQLNQSKKEPTENVLRGKLLKEEEAWTIIRNASKSNLVCADCGAADPEWASINLGILTCIECSGTHRSMGVHISKVRSLKLDMWESDVAQLMVAIGNEYANGVFESQLDKKVKPTPTSDRETREQYILAKYRDRKFVSPTKDVDPVKALFGAVENNDCREVYRLMIQGVDVDAQLPQYSNRTALHVAVLKNASLCLHLLVLNRANATIVDDSGVTPLHYTAQKGDLVTSGFLLRNVEHKQKLLQAVDANGKNAFDVATENNFPECAKFFSQVAAL